MVDSLIIHIFGYTSSPKPQDGKSSKLDLIFSLVSNLQLGPLGAGKLPDAKIFKWYAEIQKMDNF